MDDKVATHCGPSPLDLAEPVADAKAPLYLIVLSGGIPGAMLRLGPGGNALGRSAENTLPLTEGTVSRRHAVIRTDEDGLAWLVDLGSSNGTYRNGRRLEANQPVVLQNGDRLRFGAALTVKFVRLDPCEEEFQRAMFERTVRDTLTGLYNRAYFLDQLGPLGIQAAARGLGLAVLMLDIDHFKRVNDTLGHVAGDAVLREVAATIRQATRSEDLVARFGGEEFVVALPVAAPELASERAERIRRNLGGRRIAAGGRYLRVTASLGLAFAPAGRPVAAASLIAAADHCLYQAKQAGRDRVVAHRQALIVPLESTQRTSDGELPPVVAAGGAL